MASNLLSAGVFIWKDCGVYVIEHLFLIASSPTSKAWPVIPVHQVYHNRCSKVFLRNLASRRSRNINLWPPPMIVLVCALNWRHRHQQSPLVVPLIPYILFSLVLRLQVFKLFKLPRVLSVSPDAIGQANSASTESEQKRSVSHLCHMRLGF